MNPAHRVLAVRVAIRLGLNPSGLLDEILYAIEARDTEARRLLEEVMRAYMTWRNSWGVVTLPPIYPLMTPVVLMAPNPEAFPRLRSAHEALDSYLSQLCTFDPVLAN
jgi:hypothetical protein